MTPEVKVALDHVRSLFPDVVCVTYDEEWRWHYETGSGFLPSFDERIDIALLEDAADSLDVVPATLYA